MEMQLNSLADIFTFQDRLPQICVKYAEYIILTHKDI